MIHERDIIDNLPSLRRFARVLVGNTKWADTAIEQMLELSTTRPWYWEDAEPSKTNLYRAFLRYWNDPLRTRVASSRAGASLEKVNTTEITGREISIPRQAFLLVSLEKFSSSEVCIILDLREDQLEVSLQQAREQMRCGYSANILIIEDELLIALDLELIATELGHNVVGLARTHEEALAIASGTDLDLILADLNLADGSSGVRASEELMKSKSLPVIYISGISENFVTGRASEAEFFLSKPFQRENARALIGHALLLH